MCDSNEARAHLQEKSRAIEAKSAKHFGEKRKFDPTSSDDFRGSSGAPLVGRLSDTGRVRQMARTGFGAERMRVAVGCSRGGEMSDHQREIYHSENGDKWFLCRDDDGRAFVLHNANVSSSGTVTEIELADFSEEAKRVPNIKRLPG